jgi:hypothetical protein
MPGEIEGPIPAGFDSAKGITLHSRLVPAPAPTDWTLARELALMKLIEPLRERFERVSSAEMVEAHRHERVRQPQREIPSQAAAQPQPSAPSSLAVPITSPGGGAPEQPRKFWLNVNAELIIYGATDPGARVAIAGRPIRLRPDGSFSYRFSLPDGEYELGIVAVSKDDDHRRADLQFSRHTQYQGEVGAHSQDPELRPPTLDGIPQ